MCIVYLPVCNVYCTGICLCVWKKYHIKAKIVLTMRLDDAEYN